ncbi:MAG: HEPN domain-containing protein [Cyclobacteriaceae bacterium]|nr:HEPN domain-containing protein [Cyclobacteriaceae bacterium]
MNDKDRKIVVSHRLKRANNTLLEVELLIENNMFNTAINRLYYASFYAVTGLLVRHKIKAHTHGGVRQMFGLHFVKKGLIDKQTNKFYSDVFDMRLTGDYDDFVEYSRQDIIELIPLAKKLIKAIEKLIA